MTSRLRRFLDVLQEDLHAAVRRDPAALTLVEVALASPGVHAVWGYRLAHRMWREPHLRLPARLLSQAVRGANGVEDPPGSRVGQAPFIEHSIGGGIGDTGAGRAEALFCPGAK